jgi:A/G-specific adenine glycosylase
VGDAGVDLLTWWADAGRDLPWRRTRDPWAVLVCEVMAQQTQVARVVERWPVFLERFPTPAACAAAPVADVLRLWSGMGYNRRALALHACAVRVVEDHGGALPADVDALRALPGVGPYTARAVAAFAHELDHGVVDTNSARVLARWAGERLGSRAMQDAADAAVPRGQAWAWNQAMLDLGATVCLRRSPRCDVCPVVEQCAWARTGWPEPDPADGSAGCRPASPASTAATGRAEAAWSRPCAPVPCARASSRRRWGGPTTPSAPSASRGRSCATASPSSTAAGPSVSPDLSRSLCVGPPTHDCVAAPRVAVTTSGSLSPNA